MRLLYGLFACACAVTCATASSFSTVDFPNPSSPPTPPHPTPVVAWSLELYYNGSTGGPGCGNAPLCIYKGYDGQCTASVDGLCTDIRVVCNTSGIFYERYFATRDGTCKGQTDGGWYGGLADQLCQRSWDGG